jgi:hypothetical protein
MAQDIFVPINAEPPVSSLAKMDGEAQEAWLLQTIGTILHDVFTEPAENKPEPMLQLGDLWKITVHHLGESAAVEGHLVRDGKTYFDRLFRVQILLKEPLP